MRRDEGDYNKLCRAVCLLLMSSLADVVEHCMLSGCLEAAPSVICRTNNLLVWVFSVLDIIYL